MEEKVKNINIKTTIWGFLVLFSIFLEYFVHLYLGISIVYSQFFYVLIAIAGFWYGRKVAVLGVFLAIMTISNSYLLTGALSFDAVVRGMMFVLVAVIVGELSYNTEKEHYALIAYISEAAMRVKNPANSIKESLEKIAGKTEDEGLKTALGIQVINASKIVENIQEINQKIVENEKDIPEAYREFLTNNK